MRNEERGAGAEEGTSGLTTNDWMTQGNERLASCFHGFNDGMAGGSATGRGVRMLFLNKFVPPDPAPTSLLIGELAALVRRSSGEVFFASGRSGYREKRHTGWRRWWHEGRASAALFLRGLLLPRPDCIICLSDPPGCLVIAAVLAAIRRARLIHWAMDVYPETAAALGAVRKDGLLYRAVHAAMRWACDRCDAIACLDQDMAEVLHLHGDPRHFISQPWPPVGLVVPGAFIPPVPSRIRWLYSGNLGRAHDYETILRAQQRLERLHAPFDLVFQGGGPSRVKAMQLAGELGLEHCQWTDYAPEEKFVQSLLEAQVLVATQKAETRGLLWPSKLALMRLLPRPIVWVGPTDGAVAKMLREDSPRHGLFPPGGHEALAQWLLERQESLLAQPAAVTAVTLEEELRALRERSLHCWQTRLDAVLSSRTGSAQVRTSGDRCPPS